MLKTAVLTLVASLNLGSENQFFESEFALPAGVSEVSSQMDFNAVSMFSATGEDLPEIFYALDSGEFARWRNFEENDHQIQKNLLDLLIVDSGTRTLRIRTDKPIKVVAHFFNTEKKGENLVAAFDPFDSPSLPIPAEDLRETRPPQYISRSEWGANESLRVWNTSRRITEIFQKKWFETEIDEVPVRFRPKVITETSEDGRPLYWPISASPQIAKFVIHHTGEYVKEQRNPAEIMRAIYFFHTITRGWGDIGYNYVIDPQGNIYEGRAGGPFAVGAHTAFHNIGSVGISLMGNFQTEQPTTAQTEVLSLLLADHARRFKVNLSGRTFFLGQHSANVSGHRDVARADHSTACPGTYLYAKLPEIRARAEYFLKVMREQKRLATKGRDFLEKSEFAPQFERTRSRFVLPEKEPPIALQKRVMKKVLQRDETTHLEVLVRNGTNFDWEKGEAMDVSSIPEGMVVTKFRAVEKIPSGGSGIFRSKILVKTTPNGEYDLEVSPSFLESRVFAEKLENREITFPLQISGSRFYSAADIRQKMNLQTSTFSAASSASSPAIVVPKVKDLGPTVKIKLAFFDQNYADLKLNGAAEIFGERDQKIANVPAKKTIKIVPQNQNGRREMLVSVGEQTWTLKSAKVRSAQPIEIRNYTRNLGGRIKYNSFRNQLSFYPQKDRKLLVVNELPLEAYLWGLSEEPSTEPTEKKHAIHILARSYALVYSGEKRKFGTPLYDLEDDPRSSQYYLGHDWERYHSEQKALVQETFGQVLTYGGEPVIGPYFTQSSGESSNKWRSQYPWTRAQVLKYDRGLEPRGHGVGLSGNTARELANRGWKAGEILDFFFDSTSVQKVY